MNQTASKPNSEDHGFGGFMFGLTLGVLGALLLGTEEGRKITRSAIDALPDSLKKLPTEPKEHIRDFAPPMNSPMETPHHAFAEVESPPPPPPSVANQQPEYYLTSRK